MGLLQEWALPDSHIILGGQPTVGSVVAIESIFQVNVGLPNEVIRAHEVMIEYGHSQLWLGWKGDVQLQDPGQKRKVAKDSSTPSRGTWGSSVQSPTITKSAAWARACGAPAPHSQAQGPASLSEDGVELLGDVALLRVPLFLASAHHHIGVCLAIGVRGSQVGSLGGELKSSGVRRDAILETEALVGPNHRILQGAGGQTRASSTLVKHSIG